MGYFVFIRNYLDVKTTVRPATQADILAMGVFLLWCAGLLDIPAYLAVAALLYEITFVTVCFVVIKVMSLPMRFRHWNYRRKYQKGH